MNGRERIQTALERKPPDRVPVMEMAIDWKVMRGLGFKDYFTMINELDLDAIAVNQVLYLMGLRPLTTRLAKTYRDEWGIKRLLTGELLPFPVEHPVQRMHDLRKYSPPDPAKSPLLKAVRLAKKRCPGKAVIMLSRAVFAASWYLVGLENLLTSYLANPDFALAVGRMTADYHASLVDLAVKAGVDVVFLTDDYAHKSGCLMSPAQFSTFVLPGLRAVVAAVKNAGGYCVKHTDGNIWQIIDPIVETGIHGIGPLEPAAGMELPEVKKRYGTRVCIVGNVDVDLLSRGTPDDVRSTTLELLQAVAPGGGHILSSGNTISSSVRPENFRAMIDAARSFRSV